MPNENRILGYHKAGESSGHLRRVRGGCLVQLVLLHVADLLLLVIGKFRKAGYAQVLITVFGHIARDGAQRGVEPPVGEICDAQSQNGAGGHVVYVVSVISQTGKSNQERAKQWHEGQQTAAEVGPRAENAHLTGEEAESRESVTWFIVAPLRQWNSQ